VLALFAMSLYAVHLLNNFSTIRSEDELLALSKGLEPNLKIFFNDSSKAQAEIQALGQRTHRRFTLIDPSGIVIADSEHDPRTMENHIARPEVQAALRFGVGSATRFSDTLKKEMLYLALLSKSGETKIGIIRTSLPLNTLSESLFVEDRGILIAALSLAALAAILAYLAYGRVVRPLQRVKEGAVRFANGELDFKVVADESLEMQELAEAMNKMASQLSQRISTILRLETIRKDFVANVSHELRTPITSIKGSAETLLDGAAERPTDAKRFIEIIARHAERLNRIIEDLLSLARLEERELVQKLEFEEVKLKELCDAAIHDCQDKALARQVLLKSSAPSEGKFKGNPTLLEQALVNLLNNAIDYSQPDSAVLLEAKIQENEAIFSVQDSGVGIAAEHLPRIFERFYRVDKARSRKSGGTGLGLAIVKHIAEVHLGKVSVESVPGKGSLFTMVLPLQAN